MVSKKFNFRPAQLSNDFSLFTQGDQNYSAPLFPTGKCGKEVVQTPSLCIKKFEISSDDNNGGPQIPSKYNPTIWE